MLLPLLALVGGLVLLVISADRFVDGAAATARHVGLPPLLIGMVIVGLGTSAPEMVVSAFSALQGNPGLALGNAYGSNIANLALILGTTALISPILIHSQVIRKELPILIGITILAAWQLRDGFLSALDAWVLLAVFLVLLCWLIWQGMSKRPDDFGIEMEQELKEHPMTLKAAIGWLVVGMVLLVVSSRILVWGAVEVAQLFGLSDLIIGLTIVAFGTSLPELAASIIAVRKGEHDIAVGNVIGSNLFNTLAVVGIAGTIHPTVVDGGLLYRDCMLMGGLTIALLVMGFAGRIKRWQGFLLLLTYCSYIAWLAYRVLG